MIALIVMAVTYSGFGILWVLGLAAAAKEVAISGAAFYGSVVLIRMIASLRLVFRALRAQGGSS